MKTYDDAFDEQDLGETVQIELVDTGEFLDVNIIKAEAERLDQLETTGGWTPTAADVLLVQVAHLEGQEPTWSQDLWLHTIERTMGLWADAVRDDVRSQLDDARRELAVTA